MNNEYYIVVGNANPELEIQLKRENTPIDLTTVDSVELFVKYSKTQAITNSGNQSMDIITPVSGIVSWQPEVADFPNPGVYIGNVKIGYSDQKPEILYEQLIIFARKI